MIGLWKCDFLHLYRVQIKIKSFIKMLVLLINKHNPHTMYEEKLLFSN